MYELNSSLGLKELSMGMSADYMLAAKYKASFLESEVKYSEKEINKF